MSSSMSSHDFPARTLMISQSPWTACARATNIIGTSRRTAVPSCAHSGARIAERSTGGAGEWWASILTPVQARQS